MKLFCGGVGANFPDIEDASRAIKKSEYDSCVANGAKTIIEVPIGIDGLTIIEGKDSQLANLTQADIYKALAANPFGKGPNTAQTWKDVNPSLPAIKIRVLGPPPTSGTRDSLADLYLEKGCNTDPAMEALKKSDDKKHKDVCTKVREDGAYVEAGENDNLLVQKVSSEPGTLGVLGFSYLEENADKVKPVQIAGVSPTEADHRGPVLSGRAQALHLSQGRAPPGQAGAQGLRRSIFEAVGHGRSAREARSGSVRRSGRGSGCEAGDRAQATRSVNAQVSLSDARHRLHCGPADRCCSRRDRLCPGVTDAPGRPAALAADLPWHLFRDLGARPGFACACRLVANADRG